MRGASGYDLGRSTPMRALQTSEQHRFVARPALFDVLSQGPGGAVTLVSASAGSGKTVLVRAWLADADLLPRTAWVSVERDEQDAQRFWQKLIAELRLIAGDERVSREARPSPQWRSEEAGQRLLVELQSIPDQVVLVIDDLHELRSVEALGFLEMVLAGLPDHVRVVLLSRRDLDFGLHRLRLSGRITELRDADLRFTEAEACALLGAAGVKLSDSALAVLHERTEGWAAGLRLAAISLSGHPDPERFVNEFSGSERTVADYLFAEVLERQDEEVRRLLVRTSILERVNGALGDRLSGGSGSESILQALDRAGAFVSAVDASRHWFRYHHLFADLLRLELRRTEPESVVELHRAAAQWHTEHDLVVEAIRHAQAAEDWPVAARLLTEHHHTLMLNGEGATAHALLRSFPTEVQGTNADLAQVAVLDELILGAVDAAAAHLEIAQRLVEELSPERWWVANLQLGLLRLSVARRRGDFGGVVEMARGLDEVGPARTSSDVGFSNDARALALMHLGAAEWLLLRPDDAERHLLDGIELARQIDRPWTEVACLGNLSLVTTSRSAMTARTYAQAAIDLAVANGWSEESVAAPALLSRATLATWEGRFSEADDWLRRAEAALVSAADPVMAMELHHQRALLRLAQGRLSEAEHEMSSQRRLLQHLKDPSAVVVFRAALPGATVLAAEGRWDKARQVLAEIDGPYHPRAEYLVATASLSAHEGDWEEVLLLVAPVVDGSVQAMQPVTRVEGALLAARAHRHLGAVPETQAMVEAALAQAEPFGLVLPFLEASVAELLRGHPRHHTGHGAFLDRIRDAASGAAPASTDDLPAPDELSDSELRVLGYLASNYSVPEIARELYLSKNTVKTHTRHIFSKLSVNSRTDAVARARSLGLLAPR
jgi:LuxR family maltose regulon positive regulatory protein